MNNYGYLGIVQSNRFRPLKAERATADSLRLTSAGMQSGQSPESGEIPLLQYEGSAIMVRGIDSGEWIYSATVVDQAGPIVTALVRQVFGPSDEGGQGFFAAG